MDDSRVKIELTDGGPIVVRGSSFTIIGSDGTPIVFTPQQMVTGITLCVCGKSNNMPFCDGSHTKN